MHHRSTKRSWEATPLQPRRFRRTRAGFSLVEVLVAIAVLTIGIIAFLEIFPNGFLSLQVAANTSSADRLAQQELNQLSPGSGSDIQQVAAITRIYQSDTDGGMTGMVQLDPNFNLDRALSPSANLTLTTATGFNVAPTPVPTAAGAQNPEAYQYIGGERVTIPSPTAASYTAQAGQNAATPSSNVMLDFGPLTLPPDGNNNKYAYPSLISTASPSNAYNSLDPGAHYAFFVHGLPWASHSASSQLVTGAISPGGATATPTQNVPVDDPESELKYNAPEYLIDYDNAAIALRNPATQNADGTFNNEYNQNFVFQVAVIPAAGGAPVTHTFQFSTNWPNKQATATNALDAFDGSDNHSRWISFTQYTNSAGSTANNPQDVNGKTLNVGDTFVPGTEKLVRDFNEVTTFDNDPYEFMLPTALDSAAAGEYQIGELEFNPLASKIVDTRGQPLQASVDYIVQDWHTIHEDKTVGSQSSGSNGAQAGAIIRLTLPHVLNIGDGDTNGNDYNGIAGLGSGYQILVYDLDTFQPIPSTGAGQHYFADFANGTITLYGYPVGAHVRIYYHAENYWGLAVIKPAASYSISQASDAGPDVPASTGQAVLNTSTGYLYFPLADIGRQVQISGTVSYTSGGVTQSAPLNLLATLGSAPGSAATAPAQVLLSTAVSGGLPTGATITSASAPTATGATLTARAVWLQGGLFRSRDVTTVDLPSAQ